MTTRDAAMRDILTPCSIVTNDSRSLRRYAETRLFRLITRRSEVQILPAQLMLRPRETPGAFAISGRITVMLARYARRAPRAFSGLGSHRPDAFERPLTPGCRDHFSEGVREEPAPA